MPIQIELTQKDVERFWEKVDKTQACWNWTASTDRKGYGQIMFHRAGKHHLRRAHRVAYEMLYGPLPDLPGVHGACVLHRCDNPKCVNPEHLFVGTSDDNVKDMDAKGRRKVGVRFGSDHPRSVLDEDKVREIARLHYDEGISQKSLATMFGVCHSTINHIFTGRLWAHLGLSRKHREDKA